MGFTPIEASMNGPAIGKILFLSRIYSGVKLSSFYLIAFNVFEIVSSCYLSTNKNKFDACGG